MPWMLGVCFDDEQNNEVSDISVDDTSRLRFRLIDEEVTCCHVNCIFCYYAYIICRFVMW